MTETSPIQACAEGLAINNIKQETFRQTTYLCCKFRTLSQSDLRLGHASLFAIRLFQGSPASLNVRTRLLSMAIITQKAHWPIRNSRPRLGQSRRKELQNLININLNWSLTTIWLFATQSNPRG